MYGAENLTINQKIITILGILLLSILIPGFVELMIIIFILLITIHYVHKSKKQPETTIIEQPRTTIKEQLKTSNRELIPRNIRLFIWQRDKGKCVICESNEKLEFDHIIPISKGGSNTERNIQLLYENCNRTKSDNI